MPFVKSSPPVRKPAYPSHPKFAAPALKKLPQHVAVILDGNGRWAKERGLARSAGHRAGGENLKRLLEKVIGLDIPFISLYTFSTENWTRPPKEIKALWDLLEEFFGSYLEECLHLGIRIQLSGLLSKLPSRTQRCLEEAVKQSSHCSKLIANFCINYGSQEEILGACSALLQKRLYLYEKGKKKQAKAPFQQQEFEECLYTNGLPPVDLLIRTGGEMRISNFLLWQSAYAEIYVTQTLWPDFSYENLLEALFWFEKCDRRFGGL